VFFNNLYKSILLVLAFILMPPLPLLYLPFDHNCSVPMNHSCLIARSKLPIKCDQYSLINTACFSMRIPHFRLLYWKDKLSENSCGWKYTHDRNYLQVYSSCL